MASSDELRVRIVEAARHLFEAGVMSHSGHGNVSARLDGERMVITGSGNIRNLSPEGLAVVSLDGRVLEGRMDSTNAEIVAWHAGIYRSRADVGSVIHTHSPHIGAFALAGLPLPCAYEAMLRRGLRGSVPVAAWAPRGSRESVSNVLDLARHDTSTRAVLLANHGVLAFAGAPLDTAQVIVAMEEGAEMVLGARQLGGEHSFPADAFEREKAHMEQFGTRYG